MGWGVNTLYTAVSSTVARAAAAPVYANTAWVARVRPRGDVCRMTYSKRTVRKPGTDQGTLPIPIANPITVLLLPLPPLLAV